MVTIVTSVSTSVNPSRDVRKAGIMVRETLTAGSKHASIFLTSSNGAAFQYRATTSGTSANINTIGPAAPYWLKIVRTGNNFYGYSSPNGLSRTLIGSQTITMGANVYIGFAVT